MSRTVVFMFSGQGSQYYHMGEELYRQQPGFRRWMDRLDRLVMDMGKESVLLELYGEGKRISDDFDRIRFTHPAIFMIEYSLAQAMMEAGVEPGFVMGSSLGEYTAASLSGVITVEDALTMVVKQAEIFEAHCPAGGMLTILGSPGLYHEDSRLNKNSELTSVNFHSHFVVSGERDRLLGIERYLKRKQISCQLLPVSFAFHSSLIERGESAFKQLLSGRTFRAPGIDYVSCVEGDVIESFSADYFWDIVRRPILLPPAVERLESGGGLLYLDLGPSGTMANFVKNNLKGNSASRCFPIITPFGNELRKIEEFMSFFSTIQPFQVKKEANKMRVYLFPGQGSQQKGMGKDLFSEFKELTDKASAILGYSLEELCLDDPVGRLAATQYTQPALYVVNALSYLKKTQSAPPPDYVLGHSVAEYDALFASGVVDFETGLQLVKRRGELMGQAKGGGMAAVMGLDKDKVREILQNNRLTDLYIANFNSSYQIVISGLAAEIQEAEPVFIESGATHYKILNVSGAFHTSFMAEAKKKFKKFVKKFKFGQIGIPVISNVTARPYRQEEVKDNIVEQITTPVKWMESIQYLLARGGDANDFEEIGSGGLSVVKALAIRIQNEAGPLDPSILKAEEEALKPTAAEPVPKVIDKKEDKVEDKKEGKVQDKKEVKVKVKDKKEKIRSLKKSVEKVKIKSKGKSWSISAGSLGSEAFRREYNLKYAYLSGGMYKGIASADMVVRMGKAGLLGFFGSGGLEMAEIEKAIRLIQGELSNGRAYGMNFVCQPMEPQLEEQLADLFLKYSIPVIEAAAFMTMTPALVKYRARGLKRDGRGAVTVTHRIVAKVSRPEVAEQFLSPAPERIVKKLLESGKLTNPEAELLASVPMADVICVEADSGGHTDMGVPYTLMPAMLKLRDEMTEKYGYDRQIYVGAAGGIGTPAAAAAAFILGADFILTGSVNQCTVEAGTSEAVKELLQQINVQDTDYAPAADMFELGAKVQVLKKGVFFPARANKLYDLYRHYNSIDEIDEKTRQLLQTRYFRRSFDEIYEDCKRFYPAHEIDRAESNPRHKMALIFKWYFGYSTRLAMSGDPDHKVDYQVNCGPALGAFNQWVKGTKMEDWRNRHVDEIGEAMMEAAADLLNRRIQSLGN